MLNDFTLFKDKQEKKICYDREKQQIVKLGQALKSIFTWAIMR